jgi:hypothetical protein
VSLSSGGVRRQWTDDLHGQLPLLDAQEQGYRFALLHSSPLGRNMYRRIGFQEYCGMSAYVWNHETNNSDDEPNGA